MSAHGGYHFGPLFTVCTRTGNNNFGCARYRACARGITPSNTIINMLRYKTKTRPGLVALYDIRPGNGAGPFLQPRSPHGAAVVGLGGAPSVLHSESRQRYRFVLYHIVCIKLFICKEKSENANHVSNIFNSTF